MKRKAALIVSVSALLLASIPAEAGGNASLTLGMRQLQDDEIFDTTDSQPMFGITVDFGPADWPVSWAVGYYFSATTDDVALGVDIGGSPAVLQGEATSAVAELSFGVRKTWMPGSLRPFVEGGLAAVIAGVDVEAPGGSIDDSDTGAGAYVQAGLYWRIGSRFNLGINARALFGSSIDLSDSFSSTFEDGSADYVSGGLVIGWGWPAD
jgi:hypothetical protein